MRTVLAAILLGAVLAGCVSPADNTEESSAYTTPDVPSVDAAALLADLKEFAATYPDRAANTDAHIGSRDALAAMFNESGLDVWRQEFENGIPQENIAGILWGEVRDQWVVVGAHYDMTVNGGDSPARARSQGAYDDGSGTMMTVHLAKAFAALDPYYTIAFVAFDGEERGLQGSGAFAEAIVDGNHPFVDEDGQHMPITFAGMLDLDMIGLNWPGVDAPIYFDDNSPELKAHVQMLQSQIGIPEDMIKYQGISLGRSDYAHFFSLGVPTGFLISNFEEWQLPGDVPATSPQGAYPFWHLEDTWDTMVLMAGSEEDLEAGFQTAVDLSAGILHFLAMQPEAAITAYEA